MKRNYDKEMESIISNLGSEVPTLLLHTCCAPCSSRCLEELSNYFKVTVLYYNPNISPYEEYLKRKNEQIKFINEYKSKYRIDYIDCDYDFESFIPIQKERVSDHEGGETCFKCYRLRLDKCARVAKENNYDYFGTSLTVSPFKNSDVLNSIGLELENKYNVKYLVSDFKKRNGYKRSIELSSKYNLYRQDYCGCAVSKFERDKARNSNINNL